MEQYSDFSYDLLPPSWVFCFLDGCPKAEECMRHFSAQYIPDDKKRGYAVFPTALSGDACDYFKPIRKIHAAYGFDTIFKEVKRRDDKALRAKVKAYLGGNGTYYRYQHGERLLTLEQQQWIIDIFRSFGYTENLVFDHYRDVYDLD